MPKWEYKIVAVASGSVHTVDGVSLPDPAGFRRSSGSQGPPPPPLPRFDTAYLNSLGEQGWELVSYDVDHERSGMMTTIIFKRPNS